MLRIPLDPEINTDALQTYELKSYTVQCFVIYIPKTGVFRVLTELFGLEASIPS